MKRIEAPCPSCGAPVQFKTSSALVTICPHCSTVVARGDRKLEDHGKVAAIVATQSPLAIGQEGRIADRKYEIVGRVQYEHPAGGRWDEWYASLPGDRWLWLAEAQGKLYATQPKRKIRDVQWPAFEQLSAGDSLDLGSRGKWTVAEVNEARKTAAEGEIPYDFQPGPHRFADLVGDNKAFATIDYSADPPQLFAGQEIAYADLGLASPIAAADVVEISGLAVTCPQCGGSLDLKAPNEIERVVCPYCSALLDVNQGNLKYLETLNQNSAQLLLELGSEGTLRGQKYTVIGFCRRSVRFDREYMWDEYLLYAQGVGFRWLIDSDRHWSFVEPISLADVKKSSSDRGKVFQGEKFKLYQSAWATTKIVLGEFYWKVTAGEQVLAQDYVAPPRMITLEHTPLPNEGRAEIDMSDAGAKSREIIASLATYLPHEEVERAFGIKKKLPRGFLVAPNQPQPGKGIVYFYWAGFLAALFLIHLVASSLNTKPVDIWMMFWAMVLVSVVPAGQILLRGQFERRRWENSEFNPYDSGDGSGGGFSEILGDAFGDD